MAAVVILTPSKTGIANIQIHFCFVELIYPSGVGASGEGVADGGGEMFTGSWRVEDPSEAR